MTLLAQIFYCNSMENELESNHNKTNSVKFCIDAGFLNVVEIGQYFMTKDTEDFSQFTDSVALSRVHIAKKGRSIGTKRLDPRKHQNCSRVGSCNLLLAR